VGALIELQVGHAYVLDGMQPTLWGNAHLRFGQPHVLAARYLGSLEGARLWHLFEIHVEGHEIGVLLMNDADLAQLTVQEIEV